MLLYLFCLKVYFSKSEQIDENKRMIQNAIELGKPEFGKTLNTIQGEISCKNIEKKVMTIKEVMVKDMKEVKKKEEKK